MDSEYDLVVFVTTPSYEEANKLGTLIVEERLGACATIIENVRSVFRWQGKVNCEQESLMIIKTMAARFMQLQARIKENHSYTVPEIIALPIAMGSEEYLKWIREETQEVRKSSI